MGDIAIIAAGFVFFYFFASYVEKTPATIERGFADNLLFVLAIVVIAPVFEEMLFRGFLFKGLECANLATGWVILITALLSSIPHLSTSFFESAAALILGLILGFARARTGSLYVPIILQGCYSLTFRMLLGISLL